LSYANSTISAVEQVALGVAGVDLTLIVYILYRRAARSSFYRRKDAALSRYAPVVRECMTTVGPISEAARGLHANGLAEREAIKTLILGGITGATQGRATDLLHELGFLEKWAEAAFGPERTRQLLLSIKNGTAPPATNPHSGAQLRLRRLRALAIARAEAVGNLGRLSPKRVAALIREALRDPSPLVRQVAIAIVGRNQIPDGVLILLEELSRLVDGKSDLPVRSVKTALVRYPIQELGRFVPFLQAGNARFRFLAVDSIREVCKRTGPEGVKAEFPVELRQWFLEKAIRDESADVRARSAVVISYFRDEAAVHALRALLKDQDEFVRLHSVRSCADSYYAELIPDVLERVTESKWRVREAAVRTMAAFDSEGSRELQRLFLNTTDRYASEQIAEELQRSGMIFRMLPALVSIHPEEASLTRQVCSKMAALGMVSVITDSLVGREDPLTVRGALLDLLSSCEAPQVLAAFEKIAASADDPLKLEAEKVLASRQQEKAIAAQQS
jgi:HEAT repeat protein